MRTHDILNPMVIRRTDTTIIGLKHFGALDTKEELHTSLKEAGIDPSVLSRGTLEKKFEVMCGLILHHVMEHVGSGGSVASFKAELDLLKFYMLLGSGDVQPSAQAAQYRSREEMLSHLDALYDTYVTKEYAHSKETIPLRLSGTRKQKRKTSSGVPSGRTADGA